MIQAGHLGGGGPVHRQMRIAATIANAGIPIIAVTDTVGVRPATTTSFADSPGLGLDTGTYSAAQGATHAEGLVTVSRRPDLIVKALLSGAAGEGTALTLLSNTAASTDGLTITDADVGSNDMVSGTVWCISGANVGQSRAITTHTGATSFAVTVAFLNDIAVGDEFLFCPYSNYGTGAGAIDGVGNVQTTTLFTQANASIASGTGGEATVVDLELNGRTDSSVLFILQDHQYGVATN
mgnify:CR=1 FL=1